MAVIIPVCRVVGRTEGTCKVTVQGLAWGDSDALLVALLWVLQVRME